MSYADVSAHLDEITYISSLPPLLWCPDVLNAVNELQRIILRYHSHLRQQRQRSSILRAMKSERKANSSTTSSHPDVLGARAHAYDQQAGPSALPSALPAAAPRAPLAAHMYTDALVNVAPPPQPQPVHVVAPVNVAPPPQPQPVHVVAPVNVAPAPSPSAAATEWLPRPRPRDQPAAAEAGLAPAVPPPQLLPHGRMHVGCGDVPVDINDQVSQTRAADLRLEPRAVPQPRVGDSEVAEGGVQEQPKVLGVPPSKRRKEN